MSSYGYVFTSTVLTLWVILDPPGLLPVFLGLTRRMSPHQRNVAAGRATLVALGVTGLFGLFGRFILDYLHVSVQALQISGGLLLLLVALQLLTGHFDESPAEDVPESTVNVAIVPLGTPLLAGPGVIVAIMIAVQSQDSLSGYAVVASALLTAMLMVYLTLRFAEVIRRVVREGGITLLTRIAGLLLSAIAVQMMAEGVLGFVRG
ncbi:MAG TPA: MarC family protein [Propionibacteriaceae bacterium]|nr:MarC family protein [Propionibacteriaceae bacterium]